MSLPQFELPECLTNEDGWGPQSSNKDNPTLKDFDGLPYQQFNKCDRIGRIVDWLGVERYKKNDLRKQ